MIRKITVLGFILIISAPVFSQAINLVMEEETKKESAVYFTPQNLMVGLAAGLNMSSFGGNNPELTAAAQADWDFLTFMELPLLLGLEAGCGYQRYSYKITGGSVYGEFITVPLLAKLKITVGQSLNPYLGAGVAYAHNTYSYARYDATGQNYAYGMLKNSVSLQFKAGLELKLFEAFTLFPEVLYNLGLTNDIRAYTGYFSNEGYADFVIKARTRNTLAVQLGVKKSL